MDEFAPEYTRKERLRIVVKLLAFGMPIVAITQFYALPWLESFAARAHCVRFYQFSGTELMFYFVLSGLPLLSALTLFIIDGPRNIRVLKLGQNPLPDEKVFKRTRYRYGLIARFPAIIFLSVIAFLIIFAFVQIPNIEKLVNKAQASEHSCNTDSIPLKLIER